MPRYSLTHQQACAKVVARASTLRCEVTPDQQGLATVALFRDLSGARGSRRTHTLLESPPRRS